ncbi:hypothetical protein JCM5353_001776 [Sporobolomyces roseus]
MNSPGIDDSQGTDSQPFQSIFIRFDGLAGAVQPGSTSQGDPQNLEIAAGQPWEAAINEIREELNLPVTRFRLSLNRIKNGSRWRIAKSAWAGSVKPGEEVYLVATPILESSQDDKKPKDEPKPKTSPRRSTSPRNQPISPRSLSNSSSGNRSLSTEANGAQGQEVVVPATPSNTDVSDSEDEVVEQLGKERPLKATGQEGETTNSSEAMDHPSTQEATEGSASTPAETEAPPSPQLIPLEQPSSSSFPPSAQALPPPPSQQSTTETDAYNGSQARRSTSPSPSLASEQSPRYKTQLLARGILHKPPPFLINPSLSPSTFVKPPPSSIESASALIDSELAAQPSSSASLPTPAQHPQQPQPTPIAPEPSSSQPSDDSNTSWRVGIDSTGQVNFVAASSPQITSQPLPPYDQSRGEGSLVNEMIENERRRIEKGKGRAIESSPRPDLEEEDRSLPNVKREPRSSPSRSRMSLDSHRSSGSSRANSGSPAQEVARKSSGSSRSSLPPKQSSFVLEIVPSPKKRRPACLLAPRKKRRIENPNSNFNHSTSFSSGADFSTALSSSDSPASLLPVALYSPQTSSYSRTQANHFQLALTPSHPLPKSSSSQRPRPRSSLASAQRRAQDDAAALARPRCEIPPFPSSGRFCLHLRLPNAPVAPRWADARLKPVFLLKYQASGTLGNVLSKVFEYIASETLWNVRDLRLRYTDTNEDEPSEREKMAWGFDKVLTDFQNLEEWGVAEQDFLDVDFIPFSPYRTWQDTE